MYDNHSSDSDYALTNSHQSILTSDGDDSITSSVFGFVCTICSVRAIKQTELIYQYHNGEVFLTDLDNDTWIKCNECGSSFHESCWKSYSEIIPIHFICCKYRVIASTLMLVMVCGYAFLLC